MSDYRRHKKNNYTCIDNQVFKDHTLSMKAKGLLTQIYSLPDDWEYSVRGLCTLFSDGREAVNNALQELIEHGYIIRTQKTNMHGKFDGYEYDIYETPQTKVAENPFTENPITEKPITGNQAQLNTNIETTNIETTNELSIMGNVPDLSSKCPRFVPPTVEQVQAYCDERGNDVDPQHFVDYYTARGWKMGKNSVKDWKACVRTWERNSYNKPVKLTGYSGNEFAAIAQSMEGNDE